MSAVLRLVRPNSGRATREPSISLLDQYRAHLAAYGCAPATIRLHLNSVAGLQTHAGVGDPLDLTRDDVIAWLGRNIAPWSRLTYWKAVTHFSAWLREFDHDRDSDLTRGIPRPRTPEPVARPIDDATVERMLALRLPRRPHAYVRLALYQALRIHEIAKIRAEDLDLAAGWLTVTGKGGKTARIPIHAEIAKLSASMPELGYWFPSHTTAGHVTSTAVGSTIAAALKQCGSHATAHQLRDTAATRMQRDVRNIRITQAMLRHSSIRSTEKYTAVSNDDLQGAVQGLQWNDAAGGGQVLPSLAGLSAEQLLELQTDLQVLLGSAGL